jgi:hypothetical protein
MAAWTDRLEVRLSSQKIRLLRREAQRRGVSVGQVLREAIDHLLNQDRGVRMRAAEDLFEVQAPVADWPEMKREIE